MAGQDGPASGSAGLSSGAGALAAAASSSNSSSSADAPGSSGSLSLDSSGSGSGSGSNAASVSAGSGSAKGSSAFVGLVVHAAVDGVALGAAVAEGDASLGLLVFMAIMLHKAPSSFGLAAYLLHNGYTRAQVQARLAGFSASAPTGALVTYWALQAGLLAYTRYSLALCLLFSGGTFLYVATAHILPEVQAQGSGDGGAGDSKRSGGSGSGSGSGSRVGAALGAAAAGAMELLSPGASRKRRAIARSGGRGHGRSHGHGHGQDACADDDDEHDHDDEEAGGGHSHGPAMSWGDVGVLLGGLLLPLLLNGQHGH